MNNLNYNHPIEEILADLAVYQEPQVLKDEYKEKFAAISVNKNDLKKYSVIIMNVQYAWRETLKYKIYFEEFYFPDDKISKIEILNHHIYSYLEDMTILKNKIQVMLGEMKNDIKKIAANKDEIDTFFREGVEKTQSVFSGITKLRDPHHHKGMRFTDGDLLKAENNHNLRKTLNEPTVSAFLNQERKVELFARLEREEQEHFEIAKARWIETARENDEQTSGYLGALLDGVRDNLYQFLDIRPVKEVVNTPSKDN